ATGSAARASRGTGWSGCSTSWRGSTSTSRAGRSRRTKGHELVTARTDAGGGGIALRPQPPARDGRVVRPGIRLRLSLDGHLSVPVVLGLLLPRGGPVPSRPGAGAGRGAQPPRQRPAGRLRGPRDLLAARALRGHAGHVLDRLSDALPERLHPAAGAGRGGAGRGARGGRGGVPRRRAAGGAPLLRLARPRAGPRPRRTHCHPAARRVRARPRAEVRRLSRDLRPGPGTVHRGLGARGGAVRGGGAGPRAHVRTRPLRGGGRARQHDLRRGRARPGRPPRRRRRPPGGGRDAPPGPPHGDRPRRQVLRPRGRPVLRPGGRRGRDAAHEQHLLAHAPRPARAAGAPRGLAHRPPRGPAGVRGALPGAFGGHERAVLLGRPGRQARLEGPGVDEHQLVPLSGAAPPWAGRPGGGDRGPLGPAGRGARLPRVLRSAHRGGSRRPRLLVDGNRRGHARETRGGGMKALSWDTVPVEPVTSEISRQVVTGQNEMIARVLLKKGAVVPTHSHVSEQITYILEGALRLWIGEPEQEVTLEPGRFVVIPPHVPHRADALEDTVDVDVFSPIRQDWLDGTDTYFQRNPDRR